MQAPSESFPVLGFVGVVSQMGGALLLVALFWLLRRLVLRREYFSAWSVSWAAIAVAIGAVVIRYMLMPQIIGASLDERHPITLTLYFIYQTCKGVALVYLVRGTLMYVTGSTAALRATRRLWVAAVSFALISTWVSHTGLNEMVVWQSVVAVPALGYCALALFRLPGPRRTTGSKATGAGFALLSVLWLMYAITFIIVIQRPADAASGWALQFARLNPYFDITVDLLLGYGMILTLLEDAKHEVDDAQAELRLTHDRLRRAALTDSLTD